MTFNNKRFLKGLILTFVIIFFNITDVKSQVYNQTYVNTINRYVDYVNRTVWGVCQNFFIFSNSRYWKKNADKDLGEQFKRHSFAYIEKSKYSDIELYKEVYMFRNELDQSHQKLILFIDSLHFVYKQIIDYSFELRYYLLQKKYRHDNFKRFDIILENASQLYLSYYSHLQNIRSEIQLIAKRIYDSDPENQTIVMAMNLREALNYQLPLLFSWNIYMNGGIFPEKEIIENINYTKKQLLVYEKTPDIDLNVRFEYNRFYSYLYHENQKIKERELEQFKQNDSIRSSKYVIWHLISAFAIRCGREYNNYVKKASKSGIYLIKYIYEPYLFIKYPKKIDQLIVKKEVLRENEETDKTTEQMYQTLDGYAYNHVILLLDISYSMNSEDRLPLLKKALKKLIKILRKQDKFTIVVYSGEAKIILNAISGDNKRLINKALNKLESGGSTNFSQGLDMAYQIAVNNIIANGNNRIIVATDGMFKIAKSDFKQVKKMAKKNIVLSVFQFGNQQNKKDLKKITEKGIGNYVIINKKNIDLQLIKEIKVIRKE